jgi:hypothetical protein
MPEPGAERSLTRDELRALRRKEGVDADTVTRWMDQTRGLAAPEAGEHGELAANGCGWVVGLGGPSKRGSPRLFRCFALSGGTIALGTALSGSPGLGHSVLALIALSLAPMASLGLACYVGARRRLRRQLAAARLWSGRDQIAPGTLVRMRGVVAAQPTVPSLFRGVPAVLFRNTVAVAEETRGIDFLLEVPGAQVKVAVRRAMLLDRPRRIGHPPVCGPVYPGARRLQPDTVSYVPLMSRLLSPRESSIGPGDEVEVCGVLDHEPARDGAGPFDRHIATDLVIRAVDRGLLLVRKLPPAPR